MSINRTPSLVRWTCVKTPFATDIHRISLIHPTLVLLREHKFIPGNRILLGAMPAAWLSSGSPAWPTPVMTTKMRSKWCYLYVVSQPVTVHIPADDIQVVTSPHYNQYLRRRDHPIHSRNGSILRAVHSGICPH